MQIKYRKAEIEDLMTYYNWANDSVVRENAISKKTILLENHKKWFSNKIVNQNTTLYIFFLNEQAIGQVRFDIDKEIATIDYSVDNKFRGQKLGFKILEIGLDAFQKERQVDEIKNGILGIVKVENMASNKIFQKLGFNLEGQKVIDAALYNVFTLAKSDEKLNY